MKKFFIALSVLAALMLSVVPSQALIGMPDDTSGTDAVVPFICDISGTTGLNTLIVFMDTGLRAGINFHYTILTVRSETVYDDDLTGTPGDIVSTDAFTEISKMAPGIVPALEVDLDGDGVADHYAGYIYYANLTLNQATYNSVVGQFLFVDLANGVAAQTNIPMKEWKNDLPAALQPQMAPTGIEKFTPNALAGAMTLQDGNTAAVACNTFGIYPRFFILGSGDATWLMFWFSDNDVLGTVHLNFWDNEENNVSSNIPMNDELTILNIEPYLPLSIFPATVYPKEGWLDLFWDINPLTNYPLMTNPIRNLEFLGWSYMQATSNAGALNWTTLTPMWRDDVTFQ